MHSIEIKDDKLVKICDSTTIILQNNYINIEYDFNNGNYSLLIFSDCSSDICINEIGTVNNSSVNINYILLDRNNLKQNTKIDVNKDSGLNVNTIYLGINKKDIKFDLFNKESDSNVEITNNIVCLQNSDFSLDCIGTIEKGAKRSKCHQKSHCLTMESPDKARILPVLNIDENDVEASHSLSSGTIDDEIMFYMNSRGLNSKEALKLILESYLMPNDDYYRPYINGEYIKEIANKKVEDICLI